MTVPLYICSYDRGTDHHGNRKPYHWLFFLVTNATTAEGIAHQLRGMPGGFYYNGAEKTVLEKSSEPNNRLEIGEVPEDKLGEVEQVLRSVPITVDESSEWNCQDWSAKALELLAQQGWVWEGNDIAVVKAWLKEN